MGTVKVDMASKGKRIDDAYPLDSTRGVYAVLSQLHRKAASFVGIMTPPCCCWTSTKVFRKPT